MLVIALGPAGRVLETGTTLVGCTVSDADLTIATVPAMKIVPLHRVGLGVSMLIDLRSPTLLELLDDEAATPADTMAWLLHRFGGPKNGMPPPPAVRKHRPSLTLVGAPSHSAR